LGINVKPKSLGAIVRGFKSAVTNEINQLLGTPGAPFWQRNYYDQIIRDEAHLRAVRQYILNNPANWEADQLHPNAPPNKFNREWPGKGKP
jgi:REP element-mobilizing transposase RayT